jgi:sulfur-oxidizing protein SoxX
MRGASTFLFAVLILAAACRAPEASGGATLDEAASLTGNPGDPVRGREIFVSREAGHCILCHSVQGLDAGFQGNVGPDLTGIGARLTDDQIRYRIIDARRLWPHTVMPPYYRAEGLSQVGQAYQGKPVLNEQQIEDLVAFMGTQR